MYLTDRNGDPPTPVIDAFAGDPLRIHVLAPWSEQAQVFGIEGHDWPIEPGHAGTNIVGSIGVGGLEAITIEPRGGAGGLAHVPGDYLYGDSRLPYREARLFGSIDGPPTARSRSPFLGPCIRAGLRHGSYGPASPSSLASAQGSS